MIRGFTCSTFDLFHAGHVLMLEEAKRQCQHLTVGLQTDPTYDRPEKNKPIQSIYERLVQVRACIHVDDVVLYATEAELRDILLSLQIDVRVLGEEYRDMDFTGKDLPIRCYFNSRKHSFSTTELRERVYEAEVTRQGPRSISVLAT